MKSPLLSDNHNNNNNEQEQGQRGCFVRSVIWIWTWLTTRKSKECAETVMRIKNVMNMLELASRNSTAQAEGKRRQIARILLKAKGQQQGMTPEDRALAHNMLQTARKYESQASQWLRMREVAENLKIELVSKQQTMGVYEAFAQTNTAMERMTQTVNTASVDALMTSIQNQIDEGKSISEIFANSSSSSSSAVSDEDLDQELDALLLSRSESPPELAAVATANFPVSEDSASVSVVAANEKASLPPAKKVVSKKSVVL